MTGAKPRYGGMKAAMAGLAILYAAASLAVLATAAPASDRQAAEQSRSAASFAQDPLGR